MPVCSPHFTNAVVGFVDLVCHRQTVVRITRNRHSRAHSLTRRGNQGHKGLASQRPLPHPNRVERTPHTFTICRLEPTFTHSVTAPPAPLVVRHGYARGRCLPSASGRRPPSFARCMAASGGVGRALVMQVALLQTRTAHVRGRMPVERWQPGRSPGLHALLYRPGLVRELQWTSFSGEYQGGIRLVWWPPRE